MAAFYFCSFLRSEREKDRETERTTVISLEYKGQGAVTDLCEKTVETRCPQEVKQTRRKLT